MVSKKPQVADTQALWIRQGGDEIWDAFHEVLARIIANYRGGKPAPDNLDGFVYQAVKNKLIDKIREQLSKIFVDEDLIDSGSDPWDRQVEDVIAGKDLVRAIFDQLPEEWHKAAMMIMQERPLKVIAEEYNWDVNSAYRLRAYVRELICRILTKLANDGDDLARDLAKDCCPNRGRA